MKSLFFCRANCCSASTPPDAAPTALDPKITTCGTPGGGAGAAPSGAGAGAAAALPLAAPEVDEPVEVVNG